MPTTLLAPPHPHDLARSLASARAWAASRFDPARPATSLRTLGPPPPAPDAAAVRRVLAARGDASGSDDPPGRPMVYFPDADLCDGAAELASRGFLDVQNCPPHDTWVALLHDPGQPDVSYRRALVAWVPAAAVALVADGIDVNPEGCIVWLDDAGIDAPAALRAG